MRGRVVQENIGKSVSNEFYSLQFIYFVYNEYKNHILFNLDGQLLGNFRSARRVASVEH